MSPQRIVAKINAIEGSKVPRVPQGLVKECYATDLVPFNPDTVKDISIFDDPTG